MDKKRHEIVYMKLWPNMDSKLWTRSTHSLVAFVHAYTTYWNWLKPAWLCAKRACANEDACMLPREFFAYIWALIPFVISRGLHHGLLPKRDKLTESRHTQLVLYFEGVAVPLQIHSPWSCGLLWTPWLKYQRVRLMAAISFPRATLGREDAGRGPVQHPAPSFTWPSWKEVYKGEHPEQQKLVFYMIWSDFPRVLMLWENVRGVEQWFWRQQSLGMEASVCVVKGVDIPLELRLLKRDCVLRRDQAE